jgi:spermidine synthase
MTVMLIKNWISPVSLIPEQHSGNIYVKKMLIEKGKFLEMDVMGYMNAYFLEDTVLTVLREGPVTDTAGVWMSDSPNEYYAMWELSSRVKPPKILIGGLGIGLLAHILSLRNDINEISIVEKNINIIDLIKKYLPRDNRIRIIEGDFLEYLGGFGKFINRPDDYSTIIADIWKGYSEESEEIAENCRLIMDDEFPDSEKLYWLYQKEFEEEDFEYQIMLEEVKKKH